MIFIVMPLKHVGRVLVGLKPDLHMDKHEDLAQRRERWREA